VKPLHWTKLKKTILSVSGCASCPFSDFAQLLAASLDYGCGGGGGG